MMNIRSGRVHVFTYKEGLLSAVAHDLRLTARGFTVTLDGDSVHAVFPIDQLRVDGAMRNGRLDDRALKPKHKREIRDTMAGRILKGRANPEIVLRARREGMRVVGDLLMAGRSASVDMTVTQADGQFKGRLELTPTRWGILPYSAMFGALRLQDRVVVEFDFEASDAD
ncbi:MAG: hypothetical protein ACI9U2_002577 [Bradymonadia bacterium]|jgi:hypothetical protein